MVPNTPSPLSVLAAVHHAVLQEVAEDGIPSGHLYAVLMPYMRLDHYNKMIDTMARLGAIAVYGHVIYRGPHYDKVLTELKAATDGK